MIMKDWKYGPMFDYYLCDRCKKLIGHESDSVFKELTGKTANFIYEITKKGQKLHYCNEECCVQHRGYNAGKGRVWSNGFVWTEEELNKRKRR